MKLIPWPNESSPPFLILPHNDIDRPIPYYIHTMDIVSSMLDLMRRLPSTKIEENVEALIQLNPDNADDLSGNVDQPLKLRVDSATGEEYIACGYNQDGESYRSPWSNE